MKKAKIYSVAAPNASGYCWRWREHEGAGTSEGSFDLYHDCLRDARERGYEVELAYATGETAPGGAQFRLRGLRRE